MLVKLVMLSKVVNDGFGSGVLVVHSANHHEATMENVHFRVEVLFGVGEGVGEALAGAG